MLDILLGSPILFIPIALSLIVAITIHEFAHAFIADRLGDPTPRLQGRLSLNPLSHLDPLGTLMLLLVGFGWGRPVQFDPFNLRSPRRDAAVISLAGPVSNLLTATVASLIFHLLPLSFGTFSHAPLFVATFPRLVSFFLESLVRMSVILAVFNLIPIHPLDGFKIVGGFLSQDQAREWYGLERYGMLFLIFLIFPIFGRTSPIQLLISPPINFLLSLFLPGGNLI